MHHPQFSTRDVDRWLVGVVWGFRGLMYSRGEYRRGMYSHRDGFPQEFAKILDKMVLLKYFPVFARVRIQAPHAFAQKVIPQDSFLHVLV